MSVMPANAIVSETTTQLIDLAITAACARIAPVWPLDQFIAVNPWWSLTAKPLDRVAADLAAASGATLIMPRTYFRKHWESGTITEEHLREACLERNVQASTDTLLMHLQAEAALARMSLMTHVLDAKRHLVRHMAWQDEVTYQISQFCAAYFDQGQAIWHLNTTQALYPAWRTTTAHERGIGLVMGVKGLNRLFAELPADPYALIAYALAVLEVSGEQQVDYLHALLLSINGWASWCAYRKWQAQLGGADDDTIVHVLAIRLAWELVLFTGGDVQYIATHWQCAKQGWEDMAASNAANQELDWVWQRALELAYQHGLAKQLTRAEVQSLHVTPDVQATFCIDVRSEVFRRALEHASPTIQTLGFAGFFGLPIAYQSLGTEIQRPQLPGLLAPTLLVTEHSCETATTINDLVDRRTHQLTIADLWRQFRSAGTSGFSFVEVAGMLYAVKLFKDGLLYQSARAAMPGLSATETQQLRPHVSSQLGDDRPLTATTKVGLAAGILKAMTLTDRIAPIVLLVGHGSRSTNNPHAAGLDCGARCGQTGEVNARALAALLNDSAVRLGLADKGIAIPRSTQFVPALHNTTTDEVTLFDTEAIPAQYRAQLMQLSTWLAEAGDRARAERATTLQLTDRAPTVLKKALAQRSHDWSQVRPEWGLANNAAFIVAPRAYTRKLDLGGRTFLHDYDWRQDEDCKVLELIMTAPMVVTHWINMQYYASTVDNLRYGSGNKVLHNVVGGNLGVFEGNGGDLRIGLALQSLHNGREWMHQPLRLNVFILAPQENITAIIAKHAKVRELVNNQWLFLFQLDEDVRSVSQYRQGTWSVFS